MNRKRKTRRVVTYLVATVAGTILHSLIALDIMWRDARGYADEDPTMSEIHSRDGFVNILTAFIYVVVFAAPIRGIEFFNSGGGIVLNSPFEGVDGDGSATGSTSEPTPTLTEDPTLPPVKKKTKKQILMTKFKYHEQY